MDKERIAKLEKKLQQRKLTVYEVLQEDVALEWLKINNPAFLSMLNPTNGIEIINLLITPGPPQDKVRSYRIPMIAVQLLSTMLPKIYELLFSQDPEDSNSLVLTHLMHYFDTTPNFVISGYVVRILLNLMPANPARVLEFVLKSQPERMLRFLESQSIAEYLLRIIIVQDALLNVQIKERVALFAAVVDLYIGNKGEEEVLANANWMLCEAVTRLWSQKHKELGRFSGTLFRLVEAVVDNNSLWQQQSLTVAVAKQVSVYQKEAPFLICALYKKIYQELAQARASSTIVPADKKAQPKLTMRKFKYLQALFFIIAHGADAIAKQLPTTNVFSLLLQFVTRFQWHSLALIEIEKIFRVAIHCSSQPIFLAISRSYLSQKLKQMARQEAVQNKFGYGFSGFLINIAKTTKESLDASSGYGGWLKKTGGQGDFSGWLNAYITKRLDVQVNVRVVHEVAKPFYTLSKLPEQFSQFFEQTQQINKRMQSESPSKHLVEQKQALEEIENENELVYKLMSQLVAETIPDDKKNEQSIE